MSAQRRSCSDWGAGVVVFAAGTGVDGSDSKCMDAGGGPGSLGGGGGGALEPLLGSVAHALTISTIPTNAHAPRTLIAIRIPPNLADATDLLKTGAGLGRTRSSAS